MRTHGKEVTMVGKRLIWIGSFLATTGSTGDERDGRCISSHTGKGACSGARYQNDNEACLGVTL